MTKTSHSAPEGVRPQTTQSWVIRSTSASPRTGAQSCAGAPLDKVAVQLSWRDVFWFSPSSPQTGQLKEQFVFCSANQAQHCCLWSMGLPGLPPGQYYTSAWEFYLDFPVSPRSPDSQQGSPVSCYAQTCAVQPCGQTHVPGRAEGRRGPRGRSQMVLCRQRLLLAVPANCCPPASRCSYTGIYSRCSGPQGYPSLSALLQPLRGDRSIRGSRGVKPYWSAVPPSPRNTPAPWGVTHNHCTP